MNTRPSRVTRKDLVDGEREIRDDRRWERWLLLHAAIAFAIVAGIVWVRETWFV